MVNVIVAGDYGNLRPLTYLERDQLLKTELDTRLRLYGNNTWIADVDNAIQHSRVEIDNTNPNRINLNPYFELSGVGRIFDITNFVGFYFGNQQ